MINVLIPTPLRKVTGGLDSVQIEATSINDMVAKLTERYPDMKGRLADEHGKIGRFINVYVNDEDIRFLQSQETSLKDGDSVSIIPAIAGG